MAGAVIRYRAKTTTHIHELGEDGWVGINKAREWCQELAEQDSTVDLYCLLVDGTEVYYGTYRREHETDLDHPSGDVASGDRDGASAGRDEEGPGRVRAPARSSSRRSGIF